MSKIIIDATNATLGRLASYAAKKALQGNEIIIVNSESAVITGNRESIIERYDTLRKKGGSSQKGPHIIRKSERILKRSIRGMLGDHREGRGREAWKRIRCYDSVPEEFKNEKMIKSGKVLLHKKYITLKHLVERL